MSIKKTSRMMALAISLSVCVTANAADLFSLAKDLKEGVALAKNAWDNSKQKKSTSNMDLDGYPMIVSSTRETVTIDYGFHLLNYNCEHRGFNYVNYTSVPDQGDFKRYEPFHKEDLLKGTGCPSQKKTSSYKKRPGQEQYHRGHGDHQNIWDHDKQIMYMTNSMANIVPHHGVQNASGLWRKLEVRVECARDVDEVEVFLGNDWGSDTSNDHFKKSHGVTTPDRLWRVHVYKSQPDVAYAWLIPNDGVATIKKESRYRVSLDELDAAIRDDMVNPIPKHYKDGGRIDPHHKTTCSWK